MTHTLEHETVVMISDLHVGDPLSHNLDDFAKDEAFSRLLLEVLPGRVGGPTTLVLGGDFIDFPQVLPELGRLSPEPCLGTTEAESVLRIERVIDGHPRVFTALEAFIKAGNHVVVLPGNHDVDLFWPAVWQALWRAVGEPADRALVFAREGEIHERGIHLEHGNQFAFDNSFEHWDDPLRPAPDGMRLERPWGTFFMDIVYNDLEELYPFVNKVYPHSRLAWIGLRDAVQGEGVSLSAVARLLAFFLTRGKRFLLSHLLGAPVPSDPIPVARLLDALEVSVSETRRRALEAEVDVLIRAEGEAPSPATFALLGGVSHPSSGRVEEAEGLLGRNDSRGLEKRALELLEAGDVTLVAFGHTHEEVDGNRFPPWGIEDPRRVFNTGSWMPVIPLGKRESPRWKELSDKLCRHDLFYLLIWLRAVPEGSLERLDG